VGASGMVGGVILREGGGGRARAYITRCAVQNWQPGVQGIWTALDLLGVVKPGTLSAKGKWEVVKTRGYCCLRLDGSADKSNLEENITCSLIVFYCSESPRV